MSRDLVTAATTVSVVMAPALMRFAATPPPAEPAAPAPVMASAAEEDGAEAPTLADLQAVLMPRTDSEHIRLASFNIENLGQGETKDMAMVAAVLSQFDITAVIEVEEEEGLRAVVEELGSDWAYKISPRETYSRRGAEEYYGFVYDTRTVVPLDGPEGFYPRDAEFSREPYFASWRAGTFDFTVAALHAESPGNSADLHAEIAQLDEVFNYIQGLDPSENDVFLVGDFNYSPTTPTGRPRQWWNDLFAIPVECVIDDTVMTSMSTNPTGIVNHYDEICLSRETTTEYITDSGAAYNFVDLAFEGLNGPAQVISDHLPVYVELAIDQEDDDGQAAPAEDGTEPPTLDISECCKVCRLSQACGDGCISRDLHCSAPEGCACQG